METKFQTSFIPKKPIIPVGGASAPVREKHRSSLFMSLAVLLFIASIGAGAGTFAWKSLVLKSQVDYKEQLAEREKQFDADLIEELKAQNVKIDLGRQLIKNHLAISGVFDIIGRLTIVNVRFLSLDLSAPVTGSEGIKIALKGIGTNLSAVAFQSDVLSELERYGLRKIVKNPILSDPSVDNTGNVSFGFSATIDPASLSYEKSVTPEVAAPDATESP